jgi:hypothetical protein
MMSAIKTSFYVAFYIVILSCQSPDKNPGTFTLVPQPQELEIGGVSGLGHDDVKQYYLRENTVLPVLGELLQKIEQVDQEANAQLVCSIDGSMDIRAEGYTLDIDGDQIHITGKDQAGLLYGFMTLEQLMEDAMEQDVSLPQCHILDYPALPYRAIHLDLKHHLEKTEYYYELMDDLARYKINGIIAEMEDKIRYERQPVVGSEDGLTIGEWKKLSQYAMERNIEISPLIQGLGHASFILKHDDYKALRDDPGSDWAFNPLDPETYKVQFDLYLDAIGATPHGRYLHVGGDEVHTTGRGSGQSALKLQLMWLDKVSKFAEQHNRIPIFWDDMPLKFAEVYRPMFNVNMSKEEVDSIWTENEGRLLEFLDQFPKNCIYMRWNYHAPQTYGNIRAMEWFRNNGLEVMGATAGQTRWVLMPQRESNIDNIRSFAEISIDHDLNGLLLTLWDDDSPHFELYWRGIFAFSAYTWSGDKCTKEKIKSAYRHRAFGHALTSSEYAFIDRLEDPVAFWKNALLMGNKRNYLTRHPDPMDELVIEMPTKNDKGDWSTKYAMRLEDAARVVAVCDSVAGKIAQMKKHVIRNEYRLDVYEQVNELVRFSSGALLTLQAYDQAQNEEEEKEALSKLGRLPVEFEDLRTRFETVYGKTRKLNKPENYILDQDHHAHLANQSITFDWQFYAEMLFLKKLKDELL